jgi:hypothetical protein
VCAKKASRPTAESAREPREVDRLGGAIGFVANTTPRSIQGNLTGSNQCRTEGYTARGTSPVLALCRKLVEAGFDPKRQLHAYRGDTLALHVRSIGEAAKLEINSKGTGFIKCRVPVRIAPPVRLPAEAALAGAVP